MTRIDQTASAEAGFEPRALVDALTHRPGVYRMLDAAGRVIYVGKAKDLKRRVSSYFSGRAQDAKTMALVRAVRGLEVTVTPTETTALSLELELIKRHRPRFNVMLRDDKSYPSIHLTEHLFPRLAFHRGAKPRSGRLYGPYPSAGSVRETLRQLQKLFKVRLCEDSYFANRSRPCLQYQIGRCTAPCVGLISPSEYARDVEHAALFLQGRSEDLIEHLARRMEEASAALAFERAAQYRDQIEKLKLVQSQQVVARSKGAFDVIGLAVSGMDCCVSVITFRGGRLVGSRDRHLAIVAGTAPAEIARAFLLQNYYRGRDVPNEILLSEPISDADAIAAALGSEAGRKIGIRSRVRGEAARWLRMATANAEHALELKLSSSAAFATQFAALADELRLDTVPTRIECFDVSHTAGAETVAACVVFGPEGPLKSEYRRYNISDVAAGDDYGALAAALGRRYSRIRRGEGLLPDLLVIDGGRGQLGRAVAVLEGLDLANLPVVAVAKGPGRRAGHERLYTSNAAMGIPISRNPLVSRLVQQLRDEAHRFALTGHRARRRSKQAASPLQEIPGVGPKRRSALLRQFGGLRGVSRASVEDLQRVHGVSADLARSIYEHLHGS